MEWKQYGVQEKFPLRQLTSVEFKSFVKTMHATIYTKLPGKSQGTIRPSL